MIRSIPKTVWKEHRGHQAPGVQSQTQPRADDPHPHGYARPTDPNHFTVAVLKGRKLVGGSHNIPVKSRSAEYSPAKEQRHSPVGQEHGNVHGGHDENPMKPRIVIPGTAPFVVPVLGARCPHILVVLVFVEGTGG